MDLFCTAKPFLKWAGGKSQLISEITSQIPNYLKNNSFTYVEPFVGGGSVLFWVLNNFQVEKAVINDINPNLIATYQSIKENPKELIFLLKNLEKEFHSIEDENLKKEFFTEKRSLYNTKNQSVTNQSALLIFLNKTCFNGLYRVNRKGEYNVPMGNYKKPTICDEENILAVSQKLQNVEIICGDFEKTLDFADETSFFYLDPPYKPLSETSNFNSYSEFEFGDKEQIRLRDFCVNLDEKRSFWLLSNSDLKNIDQENSFFDDLYSNFDIQRVKAKRFINSNPEKRGDITELLIKNRVAI